MSTQNIQRLMTELGERISNNKRAKELTGEMNEARKRGDWQKVAEILDATYSTYFDLHQKTEVIKGLADSTRSDMGEECYRGLKAKLDSYKSEVEIMMEQISDVRQGIEWRIQP